MFFFRFRVSKGCCFKMVLERFFGVGFSLNFFLFYDFVRVRRFVFVFCVSDCRLGEGYIGFLEGRV